MDEELLLAFRAGDQTAFETLYARHSKSLGHFLSHYLNPCHHYAIDDIVQHALFELSRSTTDFEHGNSVKAWLRTVAERKAVSLLRKASRSHEIKMEMDCNLFVGNEPDPLKAAMDKEEATELREAVATLPEQQRTTVNACFFGARSHRETAVYLDAPLGTVKRRLKLGVTKLQRLISA
jgi:RNA polymerase sigma-70 factor (ECF subfamily)